MLREFDSSVIHECRSLIRNQILLIVSILMVSVFPKFNELINILINWHIIEHPHFKGFFPKLVRHDSCLIFKYFNSLLGSQQRTDFVNSTTWICNSLMYKYFCPVSPCLLYKNCSRTEHWELANETAAETRHRLNKQRLYSSSQNRLSEVREKLSS